MTADILPNSQGGYLASSAPEVDFALVLARTIGSMKDDPAQFRSAIYELARIKLRMEAWRRDPPMTSADVRRLMVALDTAIDRVEVMSAKHDELRALRALDSLIERRLETNQEDSTSTPRAPVLVVDQAPVVTNNASGLPPMLASANPVPTASAGTRNRLDAATLLRTCVVAVFALALCVIPDRQFRLFERDTAPPNKAPMVKVTAAIQPGVIVHGQSPSANGSTHGIPVPRREFPLPDVYGVYAVSNGELYELEALPGRTPDPRVLMMVNAPARNILPSGKMAFVIYRRDLATNAPDRVAVRAIAKIARAISFDAGGKANTAAPGDAWVIHGKSHQLRVAPLPDNPEMLLMRPERPDFVFPAGRYGLVFKGHAYDFTIAGPITDRAQCVERVEAANGTFYSECRMPKQDANEEVTQVDR